MRVIRLLSTQGSPATHSVVLAAARLAFPGAEVVEVDTVEAAGPNGTAGLPGLLVLAEPDAAAAAEAIQAVDARGLPRWAVVVLGRNPSDLAETVPPEEWNPPLLARVFRSALLQHELLCENLRLQGDLRTVARRISHDLCTPIGCIHTSSQVLTLLPWNDAPTIAAVVENIRVSSKEISQLIERICFVLRATADPRVPGRVEMQRVVAAVLERLEPEIRKAGVTVAQPASWPETNGVPQWLHVIWWNLLHNAITHGGEGTPVRLDWSREDGGYRFSVVDRGAGIAPAVAAGLFRPFDQLHTLPAPGLGLSIVQRLVALQGGRCGYARGDDGSDVFYFTLPAGAPGQPSREGGPPAGALRTRSPQPDRDPSCTANRHETAAGPPRAPGAVTTASDHPAMTPDDGGRGPAGAIAARSEIIRTPAQG